MSRSASVSSSSPPSFQLPSVQKENEGNCQKAANQDTTEAKYVAKIYVTTNRDPRYYDLSLRYVPIHHHHHHHFSCRVCKKQMKANVKKQQIKIRQKPNMWQKYMWQQIVIQDIMISALDMSQSIIITIIISVAVCAKSKWRLMSKSSKSRYDRSQIRGKKWWSEISQSHP